MMLLSLVFDRQGHFTWRERLRARSRKIAIELCDYGLRSLFAVPERATRIRLRMLRRPSKNTLAFYCCKKTPGQLKLLDALTYRYLTYYDFFEAADLVLKPWAGKKIYVACEILEPRKKEPPRCP